MYTSHMLQFYSQLFPSQEETVTLNGDHTSAEGPSKGTAAFQEERHYEGTNTEQLAMLTK